MVAALDDLSFAALLDALRGFIHLLPRRVPLFTEDDLLCPRNDPSGATGKGRPSDEDWGNLLHWEQLANFEAMASVFTVCAIFGPPPPMAPPAGNLVRCPRNDPLGGDKEQGG